MLGTHGGFLLLQSLAGKARGASFHGSGHDDLCPLSVCVTAKRKERKKVDEETRKEGST